MMLTAKKSSLLLLGAVIVSMAAGFAHPTPLNRFAVTQLAATPNLIVTPENNDQGITPNQIKALRKEASKRQARKQLIERVYDKAENDDDLEFLSSIGEDLEQHELVQVKGVSRDNKRRVYDRADQLAYDLNVHLQRDVTVVDIKGFAVTLYSPSPDPSNRKIVLRTSYQDGQFAKKIKAPRDHRGQIIKN